jgi:hypothetical protein
VGFVDPTARDGSRGGPRHVGPWHRAVGKAVPRPDSARVRALLELEDGDDPDKWVQAMSERKKGKGKGRVGWATLGEAEQAGQLGRAGGKEGRRKGRLGLGHMEEKERGERERESGPGPKRKGGRKRIAFKYI